MKNNILSLLGKRETSNDKINAVCVANSVAVKWSVEWSNECWMLVHSVSLGVFEYLHTSRAASLEIEQGGTALCYL